MQPPAAQSRIILAAASARSAAESMRKSGRAPVAVDLFGDRETRAVADWRPIDGPAGLRRLREDETLRSLPIAIVGGIFGGYDDLEDWPGGFLGAGPEQMRTADSPEWLAGIARQSGIAFPEVRRQDACPPEGRWVCKSPGSCGGLGVRTADSTPSPGSYFQRFRHGTLCGVSYVAAGDDAVLLGVCRGMTTRIGEFPFVYAGSVGPIEITPQVRDRLERLGRHAARELTLWGPLNIDVLLCGNDVILLEVNPRWSASMELIEQGWTQRVGASCSLFDAHTDWDSRIARRGNGTHQHVFWKRVVFARASGTVVPDWFDEFAANGPWSWTDVPVEATEVAAGDPIATAIGRVDEFDRSRFRDQLRELRRRVASHPCRR